MTSGIFGFGLQHNTIYLQRALHGYAVSIETTHFEVCMEKLNPHTHTCTHRKSHICTDTHIMPPDENVLEDVIHLFIYLFIYSCFIYLGVLQISSNGLGETYSVTWFSKMANLPKIETSIKMLHWTFNLLHANKIFNCALR